MKGHEIYVFEKIEEKQQDSLNECKKIEAHVNNFKSKLENKKVLNETQLTKRESCLSDCLLF